MLTSTDSNTDSEANSNKNLMMRRAGLSTFAWKQQDDKSSILAAVANNNIIYWVLH